jgi:hypothetical protein
VASINESRSAADAPVRARTASVLKVAVAICASRLTGGDHYIMEERPDEVTAALLELLARPSVVAHEASQHPD